MWFPVVILVVINWSRSNKQTLTSIIWTPLSRKRKWKVPCKEKLKLSPKCLIQMQKNNLSTENLLSICKKLISLFVSFNRKCVIYAIRRFARHAWTAYQPTRTANVFVSFANRFYLNTQTAMIWWSEFLIDWFKTKLVFDVIFLILQNSFSPAKIITFITCRLRIDFLCIILHNC